MQAVLSGIHHITAMVDDPQQNVDFYTEVLGLRLVKQTINFDDPSTYHLYFGDELGRPGTILTFFPWLHLRPGTSGNGQVSAIALAIPAAAVEYWVERLSAYGIRAGDPAPRFDQQVIPFYDPAGLLLELVTQPDAAEVYAWQGGPVPVEHAIRGIVGITMNVAQHGPTEALLAGTMGFRQVASADNRLRYVTGDGGSGAVFDLVVRPDMPYGTLGAGSVHHIAWRTPTDAQQLEWQQRLRDSGVLVTPVRDRQYFHSIYFREPGGVLFEIATDEPGFAIDERAEELGTHLKLPPWLEEQRGAIGRTLPPLKLVAGTAEKEVQG
jgi:glyoxalase family protein